MKKAKPKVTRGKNTRVAPEFVTSPYLATMFALLFPFYFRMSCILERVRPASMAMSAFGGRRHAGAERGLWLARLRWRTKSI